MAENNMLNPKQAYLGMDLDGILSQKKIGGVSYALNAITEGWSSEGQVTYQNEQGNELCTNFPEGYRIVGLKNVIEENFIVAWLINPTTGMGQMGRIVDCVYTADGTSTCFNFSVDSPILKAFYRKNNCGGEIYFVDGRNHLRYWDYSNPPLKETVDGCNTTITNEIDCNKLNVQPNFAIPEVEAVSVESDAEITAGTYQFAVQYSNSISEAYTGFYSITNPLPIADTTLITPDFNYPVGKSISVKISNIDVTGLFEYFNLAVIKTINNITTAELVGTYQIQRWEQTIIYTGQKTAIQLSIQDIFQKFEIYDVVGDLAVAQDVLIPSNLSVNERISYQEIANTIHLQWQTYRIKGDKAYSNPITAANKRGYMRDETYPFEFVPLLKNGKQCDGFIISSRIANPQDLAIIQNNDTDNLPVPTYKVYNTAFVTGTSPNYDGSSTYEGEWQFGEFSYSESTELIPCNDIYGNLQNTPIRHHKFPDNLVSNHFDKDGYIYPIGVKIDVQQIVDAINNSSLTQEQKDNIAGFKITRGNRANNKSIKAKGIVRNVGKYIKDEQTFYFPNYPYNDLSADPFISSEQTTNDQGSKNQLEAFDETSLYRYVFNSPDTSFFQPSLGSHLKIESLLSGTSQTHFVPVQKHSQYKFLTFGAYVTSLAAGVGVGFATGLLGWKVVGLTDGGSIFDGPAALASFQTFLDIIDKVSPRINFAYQSNSIGNYDNTSPVQNTGNKIRSLNVASYLSPGMQSVSDDGIVNNFQRESSVYLKTSLPLVAPYITDNSRIINSDNGCNQTITTSTISSYYASIKNTLTAQWGQLYSYETIDTGYQKLIDLNTTTYTPETIFGGDVFINKFAFKTKLPLFIDNRVGNVDDSDIDYRQFNNVGFPTYWMSTDSENSSPISGFFASIASFVEQIFGVKQNNFDCIPGGIKFYQQGKFYLFVYGIPYFYVESEVNTDIRQAYNASDGEFFPHVSSSIPDYWLQEINTSIKFDNSYNYNKTYSKQNKENVFTHLPTDFSNSLCTTSYPFRAIFSEPRTDSPNPSLRNNWLIYKPASYFDFPQNYGNLISLDGIENKQVLVRFENRTLLYNALLTAPTSAGSVYLGKTLFSQEVPPLDYADTDLGYIGSQHKFLLKTEYGDITTDSKRGQVFLIQGQKATDLTAEGVSKFFTEYLDFQILKYFPGINIDNHYNGVGLHGVYDSKYNRLILTKLDYKPLLSGITYAGGLFYYNGEEISLTDTTYFCNYSFTISYDFDIQAWASFHSYIPNFYVGEANYFYSGKNNNIASLWRHSTSITKYNSFYGEIAPYIIEYPFAYKYNDEILQSVQDYSKVLQYTDWEEYVETDDYYFNKCILSNNQQTSGILLLTKKPQNNLSLYNTYPKYNTDSKEILFTKSNNFYQLNTFWSVTISPKQSIWKKSCENLSIQKELNQSNCNYGKRSYNKAPMMAKDLKIRLILDDRDDILIRSQFITAPTIESKK